MEEFHRAALRNADVGATLMNMADQAMEGSAKTAKVDQFRVPNQRASLIEFTLHCGVLRTLS
jgi:hypothetical protein